MLAFPNAKINIGLNITAKRLDGYHEIQSIFFPVPLSDSLEFIPSSTPMLTSLGLPVDGDVRDNLILKAIALLKEEGYVIPPLHIFFEKNIPIGAGLGGGSSDASFSLKILNKILKLGLSVQKMEQLAVRLGADCPFFINNTVKYASGRGEILSSISLDLSGYYLLLVYPNIHISTANTYASVVPKIAETSLIESIFRPIHTWRSNIKNDFEVIIFSQHPRIAKLKEQLYASGAIYASMSGSGSTCFGLFESKIQTTTFAPYWSRLLQL